MTYSQVSIVGADSLKRYTERILKIGFEKNGISVSSFHDLTLPAVIQIHGAPHSEAQDRDIFTAVKGRLSSTNIPTVVLFHRPDEIQQRFSSELKELVTKAKNKKVSFAFLGTSHLKDAAFGSAEISRIAVPHGFFESDSVVQENPVVVGTHTSWGEMRSVGHATQLLAEIFQRSVGLPIVGYLGGTPKNELQLSLLDELLVNFGLQAFELRHVSRLELPLQLPEHPLIIVSHEMQMPVGVQLTFNLQMYRLGEAIRTGENSGSLHSGIAIPVVFEMNGAEVLEDLRVVKVPYRDLKSVESADWELAADQIIGLIQSGKYREYLKHNRERANVLGPKEVALVYCKALGFLNR